MNNIEFKGTRGMYSLAKSHDVYVFIHWLCTWGNREEALDFLDCYAEWILENNKDISIDESYEVAKKNIGYLAIENDIEEVNYRWLEENIGIYHPYFQDPYKVTPEQAFNLGYERANEFKRSN